MSIAEPKRVELRVLYQEMSDLTAPECSKCRTISPYRCCDAMYCSMAIEIAADLWDTDISSLMTGHATLPFMGDKGCVLPAHFRPLCTLHTCDINSIGMKKNDPDWTEKYFAIRNKIDEVENDIYEENTK